MLLLLLAMVPKESLPLPVLFTSFSSGQRAAQLQPSANNLEGHVDELAARLQQRKHTAPAATASKGLITTLTVNTSVHAMPSRVFHWLARLPPFQCCCCWLVDMHTQWVAGRCPACATGD